jgi:peptidoglycan/xylan/chitin deacetylase (PgdA/CDA1 family)
MRVPLIKTRFLFALLLLFVMCTQSMAQREIAITIDDLPFVGEGKKFHLNMIINTLKTNEVPATGFVIAGEVTAASWTMLKKFREAGLGLGNHTYSHVNLNRVNADAYIQEIDAADKRLAPVLSEPKYFRYPYLAMSQGPKKDKILSFLGSKNYQIAPITIDSKDFLFNQILYAVPEKDRRSFLKVLRPCYIDFIWKQTLKAQEHSRLAKKPDEPQILLIHANLLNAYVLPDILELYKQNGFNFVSLQDALKDSEANMNALVTKDKLKTQQNQNLTNLAKQNSNIENYMEWD